MNVCEFYKNICCLTNNELIQELVVSTNFIHLKKAEFVVRVGEIQNDVYFLVSGIARGYFLDLNGREVTDCFSFKCGDPAVPSGQLQIDSSSPMTIEMLEDGDFFCVPIQRIIELQHKYPELIMFYNRLLINALDEHWRLKRILNQYTAVERYRWFLEAYPGLICKIKNKYIASFLGMSPVTLSRLRKQFKESK